jgi:hypothetical protein
MSLSQSIRSQHRFQLQEQPRWRAWASLACAAAALALARPAPAQGDLIGYWAFDGNGLDQSGYGRHLVLGGGVGFASGLFGQALDLHNNGSQFAVRPIDDPSYDLGSANFTIQIWVNFNNTNREQTMLEKFSGSGGPGWTLTKLAGNQLHFYASPTVVLTSAALSISNGDWHQIVVRRIGTRFDLMFDAVTVATGFSGGPVPDTGMPLLIGKRNDNDGRNFAVDGRIDAVAIWKIGLCDQAVAASHPLPFPTANAGADQSVPEGTAATLDGSGSSALCGTTAYTWTQVAGTPVTLDLTDPARPTFTAPFVPIGGTTLTFELITTDQLGDSAPDFVNVTVTNVNRPPVANAGDDQAVAEASPVALDGSNSYDEDDEPLSYTWTQTGGPSVSLDLTDPVRPTFVAPLVGLAGEVLVFELAVSDTIAVSTDSVSILVENVNHAPTADAGPDQTRGEGALVALDGSASNDPDSDTLAYSWLQIGGPSVVLDDPNSATPSFTAPLVGSSGAVITLHLLVDDGYGGLDDDEVAITVQDLNSPPACELARPSVAEIWPPNHKMVAVSIIGVTDPNNDGIVIRVLGVTQDEPIHGLGDGDTAPDAAVQGNTLLLRAERSGNGNGRVYRVTFEADDGHGGLCTGTVTVRVPHNMGKNAPPAIDDGQSFNSFGS